MENPQNHDATVEQVESLAQLLDSQFAIPGIGVRVGLDTIIGLIPGIGDTISLGIASYIIAQARRIGARKRVLTKMSFNVFIDWLIGLVPIIGDLFDIGWKSNLRNAALLREEHDYLRSFIPSDPQKTIQLNQSVGRKVQK